MTINFGKYQSVDELIDWRQKVRVDKNYALSDVIRNHLDEQLVFIFDQKDFQDVYYLTKSFFKKKDDLIEKYKTRVLESDNDIEKTELNKSIEQLSKMTNRQYVEYRIKEDIKANKVFDAWLFSVSNNNKNLKM